MKIIVDVSEENYKYLNAYATQKQKDMSEIINSFVDELLTKPNKKLESALNNKDELEHFKSVFTKYMHEDLESMYSLIDSTEEIEEDCKMLEVYKHIYLNILSKDINFLEMFEIYTKASKDKL
ncbi:hypothetical protein [Staphylococcus hyicus]|uniref:hypothetical protein n=1 Tax=Staphylococcus hyicus TaxID=1284 RepID=UPI003132A3E7